MIKTFQFGANGKTHRAGDRGTWLWALNLNKLANPSVGKLISVLRILSRRRSNKWGASARRLRGSEILRDSSPNIWTTCWDFELLHCLQSLEWSHNDEDGIVMGVMLCVNYRDDDFFRMSETYQYWSESGSDTVATIMAFYTARLTL